MRKILFVVVIAACILVPVLLFGFNEEPGKIEKGNGVEAAAEQMVTDKSADFQEKGLDILLEGKSLKGFGYKIRIDNRLNVYAPERFLEDLMGCSVNQYSNGNVEIDRNSTEIKIPAADLEMVEDEAYIPISEYVESLGFNMEFSFKKNQVNFTCTDGGMNLPKAYDMRDHDRVSPVRDQGQYGTCWAFASLAALESASLPKEDSIYSVDHMSRNNGYNLDISDGGEHTMSIAYMAAWRGPVYEKDDEYGDGKTDDTLEAVRHLEEAIIMNKRDDSKIKGAIYKYGGVETSLYMEMTYGSSRSQFYNEDTASYYYDGDMKPNHDMVIVGWDDDYPKEKFSIQPSKDGAYICKNSWGEDFGDGGYIYVSYEDKNIGKQAIVYTRLGEKNNYDNIYQSDILGWVGQMGFNEESAYFANVYTAKKDEILKAISFYATGDNTTFSVFIVPDYKDESSLNSKRIEIGKGETRYSGYYTVDLTQDVELRKGQKYAVIVSIKTPGSEKPIAIECDAGKRTEGLDLSDGEGYMSLYGEVWHSAEEENANICLKAFTDNK